MAIQSKPWYQSSTIWINVGAIVALGLDYFLRSGSVQDADVIAIVTAVINILRRFQVSSPVKALK